MVNSFSFVGHVISVASTHVCHYRGKAAIDNAYTNGRNHVPIKFYLQERMVSGIWPLGCSL